MSVTFGFYNSRDGDRRYDAVQMSSIFDGIIRDGVIQHVGDDLMVTANGESMTVNVGLGRAWFDHTWTLNDALLPLEIPEAEAILDRIDAVVIEVDAREIVRANSIKIVKGKASSSPVKPDMLDTNELHQHPLAFVTVKSGATSIRQADIENAVGTSACPFVTAPLEKMDVDALIAQWKDQWDSFYKKESDTIVATRELWEKTWDSIFHESFFDALEKYAGPEFHRAFFRGKNLGSELTADQADRIDDGTFKDIWLGDYWEIDGNVYRVADFDYWEDCGGPEKAVQGDRHTFESKHHLAIVPDKPLAEAKEMNSEGSLSGGYYGCDMRTNINEEKEIVSSAFGSHVMTVKERLINAVDESGLITGMVEADVIVELPSEIMVYGRHIFGALESASYSLFDPERTMTNDRTRLALFDFAPRYIVAKDRTSDSESEPVGYWLRDAAPSAGGYAVVTEEGKPSAANPTLLRGVRPIFAIGK